MRKLALIAAAFAACQPDHPPSAPADMLTPPTPAPSGLDVRPANPTCLAPARPMDSTAIQLKRVFAGVQASLPVLMLQAPGDPSRWYLVQKGGKVVWFPNQDATTMVSPLIDITGKVNSGPNEAGLLGMAFHPQYATNRQLFLEYTAPSASSPANLRSTLSRFTVRSGVADPASEQKVLPPNDNSPNVLDKPYPNHNGGNIAFGPDGYLYVGYGDGGSGGDPQNRAQDLGALFGKMLRLDVDHVPAGKRYGIPPDNPFALGTGGAPELYAWGLRNPWRFSFDRATGELWAGDVGQDRYEEIDKIERGGNYGWNRCEGFHTYPGNATPCTGSLAPVAEYAHASGASRSITGGYVYRGSAIPSLAGGYLYADEVSGTIGTLVLDPAGGAVKATTLLESGLNISSFAQDEAGELYVLSYTDGAIYQIVAKGASQPSPLAQRLSQTGCVDPQHPALPVPGLIPYDVSAPLWSDGAEKRRWLALPDGAHIHVEADGDFTFPAGTVLMKQFSLGGKPVETRLFMRHPDGVWAGYSYEWADDGSDATLLPADQVKLVGGQSWTFPSRSDCLECHTAAAGRSLGPEVLQLNRDFVYASTNRLSNQLATLDHIGLFDAPLMQQAAMLPALPAVGDGSAPLETRARAYLHANCSFCHRPNSTGQGPSDWRFGTPWAMTRACDEMPQEGGLGVANARLIVPGAPARSIVSLRMHALNADRMPPLATHVVDATGAQVVDGWIAALTGCAGGVDAGLAR